MHLHGTPDTHSDDFLALPDVDDLQTTLQLHDVARSAGYARARSRKM